MQFEKGELNYCMIFMTFCSGASSLKSILFMMYPFYNVIACTLFCAPYIRRLHPHTLWVDEWVLQYLIFPSLPAPPSFLETPQLDILLEMTSRMMWGNRDHLKEEMNETPHPFPPLHLVLPPSSHTALSVRELIK